MQITKILQKIEINKFSLGENVAGPTLEIQPKITPHNTFAKEIAFKALDFRQSMYEKSDLAIIFSRTELKRYLKSAKIEDKKCSDLVNLFDEIIKTAECSNIQDTNNLIEAYFELLDSLSSLNNESKTRIKYSIEQTVGTILIETASPDITNNS